MGVRDGHRQEPCLLPGMVRPPLVAAEAAVELELGDPDDGSVELGHDDLLAFGAVSPADS